MLGAIVGAFLIGGAFCAAFQVIQNYTGSIPPKILLLGIGCGALAAALGIMSALGEFAGAGTGILVIGFGEAVYMAVQGALAGNWVAMASLLVVLAVFCLMGVVAGAGHLAVARRKRDL